MYNPIQIIKYTNEKMTISFIKFLVLNISKIEILAPRILVITNSIKELTIIKINNQII